jgi:predicted porin
MYGNTGAAGGLTSSANSDRRTTLNAYAMVGDTKIGVGVIGRKLRAAAGPADSDLYYLGASTPLGPQWQLDAQVARRNLKGSNADTTLLAARVSYLLSKRTAVYGSIGQMRNHGTSAVALDAGGTVGVGMTQNGVMTGLRHTF